MRDALDADEHGLVRRAPPRPIPGGPRSVADVLDRMLDEHPGHEALVGRSARYTYAELDAHVDAATCALLRLGVRPGDRVAASLPNDTPIVVAFLAAMRLGAIWVGISTALAPPELRHILRDCAAATLLATPAVAAGAVTADSPAVRVLTVDADGRGEWPQALAAARGERPRRAPVDPHAPAAIAYTSGTTGFPKGAVHTQHNMLWPGADGRMNDPAPPDERHGVMLPLTLLNLQVLGPLFAFLKGTTCVCVDRTDPVGLAWWIRTERITRLTAVPTVLHDLLTSPDVDPADLASLRRPECGGAATPQPFRDLFRQRFGRDVLTGYGLTEAPTAVTREMPGDTLVPGSSGRPFAPVEVVILDDDGRELAPGQVGEICVRARRRGPWAGVYTPFLGYWRRPEATRHALRGGLLHTDDLGMLDVDGRLFVKDRRANVIVRGGANVYPAEVERVLHEHRAVVAAAVLGVPDERLGERVMAVVQLRPGHDQVDADELAGFCRERLARYKVPQQWRFVDDFARTPMGKIRRGELLAEVHDEQG
jgi:acyl-CoA synthetase (AMP-forming)/AMP-acid ligase II